MTVEELVRSWKDPDHRTGTHPAGEIVLRHGDGEIPSVSLDYFCTTFGLRGLEEPAGDL
ncbi:hypothetical protein Lfu02_01950 [Longispora fulva]|uniref:Uncharacterized protein n=1 Tax=Longispora fulva TaxID=619741 RepID=A0A8J7G906_9ACTN|nr:hypothetical protein [Longispora fulva]MBG6135933.1 hypothetical protein [Longispora fulva]GIG55823.1 hypothetical protein Lfu02_01950 [Longispora fulva]